eukprot:1150455-Pleurochrysis_carterae.AAC.1
MAFFVASRLIAAKKLTHDPHMCIPMRAVRCMQSAAEKSDGRMTESRRVGKIWAEGTAPSHTGSAIQESAKLLHTL